MILPGRMLQGDQAFMTWDFLFHMRCSPDVEQKIRGASHRHFADNAWVKPPLQSLG